MKLLTAVCAVVAIGAPTFVEAQQNDVLNPAASDLTTEQTQDLKKLIDKELTAVVKSCAGGYPRPEFFTTLEVSFELRKSGELRGSYVPAGVVDSSMYVKSDEERAKFEEDGSLARLIVGADRDIERCFQKGTRAFQTGLDRHAASITTSFAISWKGATPTLKWSDFQVTKTN